MALLAALNYSELHLVTVLLFPSFSPPTARHLHLRIAICNSGAAVAAAAVACLKLVTLYTVLCIVCTVELDLIGRSPQIVAQN